MAASSAIKKEKKAANSAMPLDAEKAVSSGIAVKTAQNVGTSSQKSALETDIIEAFKAEFKGMPYTELNVIVQCGRPSTPTYQEIELPMVAKLLEGYRSR
jgi:hypothetical protein